MAIETKNQLALHQARKSQLDRSSQYTETFFKSLDPETDYEKTTCPTCDYQPDSVLFKKRYGEYCYCPGCDHIFLANPLTSKRLIEFYTNYPTSSLEWHQNESEFYQSIYQQGINLFNPFRKGAKLLDIGCSSGYFLSIANKHDIDAFGVEPNAQEARYALDNGINVIGSTIDDALSSQYRFDIITLWDVLEHIREPIGYISNLRKLLNNHALIFVQVPTSDSLAARIMRSACNMFDGVEHLTLFSSQSLDLAFRKAGFVCLSRQSVISEMHAITNYLGYQVDPYLGSSSSQFKPDFLSADTIESAGLGYKIQAVYQVVS